MAEINLKTLTAGVSEIDVNFNGTLEGQADATIPLNVNLTDGTNPVTPTSVALTGNDLDIEITPASGISFETINPTQYTSYRTGDIGWRIQNGFFLYTPPIYPKAIAELDFNSQYFWNVLKSPLVVNGVSSTTRFVDVDGGQTFSATGNKNLVVIDKLTGMMYNRNSITSKANWNACIDDALSYSIVVNGVTYDDWFLACKEEFESAYHLYAGIPSQVDTLTGIQVMCNSGNMSSSTTSATNTANHFYYELALKYSQPISKTIGLNVLYVRNARNLITAP